MTPEGGQSLLKVLVNFKRKPQRMLPHGELFFWRRAKRRPTLTKCLACCLDQWADESLTPLALQTDRQTVIHTDIHTYRQTDIELQRQTDRQIDLYTKNTLKNTHKITQTGPKPAAHTVGGKKKYSQKFFCRFWQLPRIWKWNFTCLLPVYNQTQRQVL